MTIGKGMLAGVFVAMVCTTIAFGSACSDKKKNDKYIVTDCTSLGDAVADILVHEIEKQPVTLAKAKVEKIASLTAASWRDICSKKKWTPEVFACAAKAHDVQGLGACQIPLADAQELANTQVKIMQEELSKK